MRATYTSRTYAPEHVTARYVRRCVSGEYQFCEVGADRRYDIRQGVVDADELPDDVREAADNLCGHTFAYVPWPITEPAL